jgi:hypothetical protein
VIPHAKSLAVGLPTDLLPGATGANGHGGVPPEPSDEGEEELVRGWRSRRTSLFRRSPRGLDSLEVLKRLAKALDVQ